MEEMFDYAEKYQCLWQLEYICRKKASKEIKNEFLNLTSTASMETICFSLTH